MDDLNPSLPDLSKLIERRLELMRNLAESLEATSLALAQNNAEATARGAAHQAELCRQWALLEQRLPAANDPGSTPPPPTLEPSGRLQQKFDTLAARIRYITRVHWSLLASRTQSRHR